MVEFFVVNIDNHEAYDMNQNYNVYFESYIDAYNYCIDHIYESKNSDYYEREYFIIYKYIITNDGLSKLICSTFDEDNGWVHGGHNNAIYGNDKIDWTCQEISTYDKLFRWYLDEPYVFNGCGMYHVESTLEHHNNIVVEELQGYKEFCKHTLALYHFEEMMRIHDIIETCNLNEEDELMLSNLLVEHYRGSLQ